MDKYINANNFKARVRKQQNECSKPENIAAFIVFSLFLQAIDEEPAADVQHILHGRWIGINEYCKKNGYIPSGMGIYYWCSECGKEEPKISDYCPNCGARMIKDGEQND